jgi:DNA-binding winged helix-turn-helix (wHTH) protein
LRSTELRCGVSKRSALGTFELDVRAGQLHNKGRIVRLAPQPFKLLTLLTSTPGRLVTRQEIRTTLWDGDTFIDFEQSVNFTVKQVREALNDNADRAIDIETVPKRGYRFIAPVDAAGRQPSMRRVGRTEPWPSCYGPTSPNCECRKSNARPGGESS